MVSRPVVLVDRGRVVADPRGGHRRRHLDRGQPVGADARAGRVLYALCGMAITAGYHRLFAHRTYRASPPVRWAMLAFGAATFQNSALSWSADHRAHHADTDGAADPHAVTRGRLVRPRGLVVPPAPSRRQMFGRLGDLWSVRSIRWQHRWYPVVAIGIGLRRSRWPSPRRGAIRGAASSSPASCAPASCCRRRSPSTRSPTSWARSAYDQRSSARDSTLTALVTFGEGYHSFHHRFPFDYRNGVRWWHYDPSKWLIWTMARMRLVNTVRSASPSTIAKATATSTTLRRSPVPTR